MGKPWGFCPLKNRAITPLTRVKRNPINGIITLFSKELVGAHLLFRMDTQKNDAIF